LQGCRRDSKKQRVVEMIISIQCLNDDRSIDEINVNIKTYRIRLNRAEDVRLLKREVLKALNEKLRSMNAPMELYSDANK
jgi:hypothetical protein